MRQGLFGAIGALGLIFIANMAAAGCAGMQASTAPMTLANLDIQADPGSTLNQSIAEGTPGIVSAAIDDTSDTPSAVTEGTDAPVVMSAAPPLSQAPQEVTGNDMAGLELDSEATQERVRPVADVIAQLTPTSAQDLAGDQSG